MVAHAIRRNSAKPTNRINFALRTWEGAVDGIGIALSGGGYRATVWGLGALLYLTDSEQHRRVTSISSVSGGSVANGVLAARLDYTSAEGAELRSAIRPALQHIAHDGLFFFGRATNRYVIPVLGLACLSLVAVLASIGVAAVEGGVPFLISLVASVVLLALTAVLFARRSLVTERALARVHFTTDGRALLLADVDRSAAHIFCATELQAGNHFYFCPRFVYGYRHGLGEPGDLPLSTAVQASACLPGAFAPRRLPSGRHRFRRLPGVVIPSDVPEHVIVNDGGVYDNMGSEWFAGYRDRAEVWADLPTTSPLPSEVVVVNASGGWGWRPIERWGLIRRELTGLFGSKDVLYNASTRVRRRDLIELFQEHQATGHGVTGALVHIPQSPFTTADGFAGTQDARGARAQAVLDLLGDSSESREWWDDTARHSSEVKTVLRALGPDDAVALLHHAYVLAMCNLHVVLGFPLLDLPTRGDFRKLVDQ